MENGTIGENALLWSLASKPSWLTALLQPPGESHFWRKYACGIRFWTICEKAKHFTQKQKRRENQGTVFLVFWWDTAGCGGEVQSSDHRQQQTESWGRSASVVLRAWGTGRLKWGRCRWPALCPLESSVSWQVREARGGVGSQRSDGKPQRLRASSELKWKRRRN